MVPLVGAAHTWAQLPLSGKDRWLWSVHSSSGMNSASLLSLLQEVSASGAGDVPKGKEREVQSEDSQDPLKHCLHCLH